MELENWELYLHFRILSFNVRYFILQSRSVSLLGDTCPTHHLPRKPLQTKETASYGIVVEKYCRFTQFHHLVLLILSIPHAGEVIVGPARFQLLAVFNPLQDASLMLKGSFPLFNPGFAFQEPIAHLVIVNPLSPVFSFPVDRI